MTPWALTALAWTLFIAAVVYSAIRFRTSGDITYFLPEDTSPAELEASRMLADSELSHAMVLLIGGDEDAAVEAAGRLAERLARSPHVAWVESGASADLDQAMAATYFPARFGFLSDRPDRELPELLSDAGLARQAQALRSALAGPLGAALSPTAPADPFLAFHRHLERIARARPGAIEVVDGGFVTREGRAAVVFLATREGPFEADVQRKVLGLIAEAFHEVGGGLTLEMAGVNRLATRAEESARDDVTRIGTLALLGTSILFLLCFRSLRYWMILFVPVGFGMAGGLAAGLAIFGEVHGVTLAFGATLIGVSDDYTIHFLQHHMLSPSPEGPRGSLRTVWSGILLGGITTIVGFAGMAWTSTPGMRQIAVFGSVGIAFALLATRAVIPTLVPRLPRSARGLLATRRVMTDLVGRIERRRAWLPAIPLAAAVLWAWAWTAVTWDDDPAALTTIDADLMREDARVRERVSSSDPGRFVLVDGPDAESALRLNDAVFHILREARDHGELGDFRSLHQILWSADLQARNLEHIWGAPDLYRRLSRATEAAGFRPGAFGDFGRLLAAPPPDPVRVADLEEGGLTSLLRGSLVVSGGRTWILTTLQGVSAPEAIRARLAGLRGVSYFDQGEYVGHAYRGFRRRVLEIVGFGLLAVLAVLWLRYRRWRHSLAAFVPAVLAAITALAVLAIAGVALNLLHVLGLLWVLSTGEDYSVFVVEASRKDGDVGIALVGTAVSCATTVLAFGLLAMSSIPALRALGLVAAIGGALSFLMTPVAFTLLGRRG
jgi:predicted exporter